MDAYGHVNHANTVTLLEEARAELLFVESARQGAGILANGMVVARLVVDYHVPLIADGRSVRVEIVVHNGRSETDTVVATAETLLVPYNLESGRPRRLVETERDFLAGYRAGAGSA
jgi:acyl-CoA thioester hydrolase